jgi:hypothetical protein
MSRRTLTRAPNPHQAPPASIATRRDLFGSMGALLLLTAAEAGTAKAAELDGELISMCEEVVAIDQESDRLWEIVLAHPEDTEGTHPSYTAYCAYEDATLSHRLGLIDTIVDTPARTPEGLRAKAAAARSTMPVEPIEDRSRCDRLALSLYEDMLGRAGA